MQRHLRLRRSADFERLRQVGRTAAHPLLVVSAAPNDLPHNRYGIITSRRLGNAVQRNRARRRIRAALQYWQPHLPGGYDLVVIARPRVLDCPFDDLLAALGGLLTRAGLSHSLPKGPRLPGSGPQE